MALEPSIRVALNEQMRGNLRPLAWTLAAIYLALSVAWWFGPRADVPQPVPILWLGSSALFAAVGLLAGGVAPRQAHPVVTGMVLVALNNLAWLLWLSRDFTYTAVLYLILLGGASLLLSVPWFMALEAISLATWTAMAVARGPPGVAVRWGYTLFAAVLLAGLVQVTRVRTMARLEHLRQRDAQRIQTEAAARENLERFKVLAESAPIGIFHTAPSGNVDYANQRWMDLAGCDYRDAQAVRAAVHPDDRPSLTEGWRKALAAGTELVMTFRFRHADGRIVRCSARASPVRAEDGSVTGFVGAIEDVTERDRAEQQRLLAVTQREELEGLRAQNEFKARFINFAAHELSTPLTPIQIQLRILRTRRDLGDAQRDRALELVDRNLERLAHLVRDLLQAAKLQAQRIELRPARLDMAALMGDAIAMFREPAELQGVRLVARGEGPLWVMGDAERLTQVVFNVLSNALKFTPRGGSIEAGVGLADGMVEVRVKDSGIGIAGKDVDRLFQPFVQLHEASHGHQGGTGLGLYISKGIAELHGAKLWAQSDGPGQGTTVILRMAPSA